MTVNNYLLYSVSVFDFVFVCSRLCVVGVYLLCMRVHACEWVYVSRLFSISVLFVVVILFILSLCCCCFF